MSVQHVSALAERRLAEDFLYLLLDPLASVGADHLMQPASLREVLGEEAVTHVSRRDLAHDSASCPALVRLAGPGETPPDALLEASAACAADDARYGKRQVCGWMASALDLDAVAAHVADICIFHNGSRSTFIPIFEPTRLELLSAADMGLVQGRLGPLREWLLPASNGGDPILLSGDTAMVDAQVKAIALEAQDEAPLVAILLSVWRDALQAGLPGALWAWRGDSPLPPNAAAEAFRQIRHARSVGLSSRDDIVVLAVHRLVLHPRLHEHPPIAERIRRAARGERPLSDFFAPITDAQWTDIVHALMDSRTTTQ